jgi:hypothetical protein
MPPLLSSPPSSEDPQAQETHTAAPKANTKLVERRMKSS